MSSPSAGPAPFPSTLWSELISLQKLDAGRGPRLESLIKRYWPPVYWVIRGMSSAPPEEAKDLTQEFFVEILEGAILPAVDPNRGSFRSFLRGSLRNFLSNQRRKGAAEKRGGGKPLLSLEFEKAGPGPATLAGDPERALDRAWAHHLMQDAVADLQRLMEREGRKRDFEAFSAYDLGGSADRRSYEEVGATVGLTGDEVWKALRYCRQKLREILTARIAPSVRSEAEAYEELRELFGS